MHKVWSEQKWQVDSPGTSVSGTKSAQSYGKRASSNESVGEHPADPAGTMSDTDKTTHDQNFKNLILDFTLAAVRFFGGPEGWDIPDDAVFTPLRQEQLKYMLSDSHHELDTPLEVRLPGGEREAIVYVLEEDTEPRDFSIHRLSHYVLEVAELNKTRRVVPIVIFLRAGEVETELVLGTERETYLKSTYIACHLARLNALQFLQSENIVARILLPCMHSPADRRVEVVARAIEGVITLEANIHKQQKYVGFVGRYAGLSAQQRVELERVVEQKPWRPKMMGWFEEAEAKGEAKGGAKLVLRLLELRGLTPTPEQRTLIMSATDEAQILAWFDRANTAKTVDDVLAPSVTR